MEIAYDEPYYALHRRKHPVLTLDPQLILKGCSVSGEASSACRVKMAVAAAFACLTGIFHSAKRIHREKQHKQKDQ
jgi:hypothetical protein